MEPLVRTNENIQIDFTSLLPNDLKIDGSILVATDKCSKFPKVLFFSITTPNNQMQGHNSNNGVTREIRCYQEQTSS